MKSKLKLVLELLDEGFIDADEAELLLKTEDKFVEKITEKIIVIDNTPAPYNNPFIVTCDGTFSTT